LKNEVELLLLSMLGLALIGCPGESCDEIPADRLPSEEWAQSCVTNDDCPSNMLCVQGAAGGYYYFYEFTCTLSCSTDDDCPVIQDESCGEGDYCSLVSCHDDGYCLEETCA
jgi:hypothetical protein